MLTAAFLSMPLRLSALVYKRVTAYLAAIVVHIMIRWPFFSRIVFQSLRCSAVWSFKALPFVSPLSSCSAASPPSPHSLGDRLDVLNKECVRASEAKQLISNFAALNESDGITLPALFTDHSRISEVWPVPACCLSVHLLLRASRLLVFSC